MRILLVSPSNNEAAYLHKALQEGAHSVQRADDYRDGVFLSTQERFEAIVVVAPKSNSYAELIEVLPKFSAALNMPALIALLGPATAAERVRVLRAGADACFGQPYSLIEMQERMQSLRRVVSPPFTPGLVVRSSLKLDALTRELVEGERRMAVTRREYLLFECLLRDLNAPVPRDQLIRYVWPEKDDVDPSSVNLMVARLRRKLIRFFPDIRIETISRFGYQLSVSR
jgi:two-component system OmpR family response regulator